jgi:pentatricopeptide repeat protein
LKICSNLQFLEKGLDIHSEAIKKGFEKDAFLSIAIVDMYAKCDLLQDAKCVYDMLPTRDVFVLNALLSGYVEFGSIYQLEECLNQIEIEGLLYDSTTFALVLKLCGKCENVRMGQDLYRKIVKIGLEDDLMIIINLTEMYVKYALTIDAQKVSDNLPSAAKNKLWTSIKIAFKENEPIDQALGFLNQMQFEHISQSPADCACILKACSATKDVVKGQDLHTQIVHRGFDMDLSVSSTLVDMYAKCGSLTDAHELFDKLPIRDVVSWNIIIAGYVEENAFQEALHLFSQMQKEGIAPSSVTSICILKACGSMGIVEKGNQIHKDVVCKGFDDDLFVENTVIDMYVKCGLVSDAHEVFAKLSVRDIASWNSMIAGYGINHDTRSAMQAFEAMQCDKSVVPDATTFICLLSACSRGSLVDEGHKYFRMMGEVYGIVPAMDHWNCIVDLFARAGDMHEAMKIIGVIGPYSSLSRDMLTALLTACRTCSQVDLGLKCFEQLAQIEKGDSTVDRIHRKILVET